MHLFINKFHFYVTSPLDNQLLCNLIVSIRFFIKLLFRRLLNILNWRKIGRIKIVEIMFNIIFNLELANLVRFLCVVYLILIFF